MTGDYCVDANSFITSWNTVYPVNVFPSLWPQIAQHQNDIILIKPIFDEIDPVSPADRNLHRDQKNEKYPLLVWLEENAFTATDITDHIKIISLDLEKEYEININPKGVVQKLHCIDCVCKV